MVIKESSRDHRRRPSGTPGHARTIGGHTAEAGRGRKLAGGARPVHSEKAQRFYAVADQQVFGLLIVIEHHFMRFAANP